VEISDLSRAWGMKITFALRPIRGEEPGRNLIRGFPQSAANSCFERSNYCSGRLLRRRCASARASGGSLVLEKNVDEFENARFLTARCRACRRESRERRNMLVPGEPQLGCRCCPRVRLKFDRCGSLFDCPKASCLALKSPAAMTKVPESKTSLMSRGVITRNDRQLTVRGLDCHGGGCQVLENGKRDLLVSNFTAYVNDCSSSRTASAVATINFEAPNVGVWGAGL
jgi:hypothetical protein